MCAKSAFDCIVKLRRGVTRSAMNLARKSQLERKTGWRLRRLQGKSQLELNIFCLARSQKLETRFSNVVPTCVQLCGDHRSQVHDTSCGVLLDKGWYSRILSGSSRFFRTRPNRGGKSATSTPFVEDLTAQSCCSEQCGPVALCETAFVPMSF